MESDKKSKQELVTYKDETPPSTLIALAIEKGVDMDKLERLFAMQEKYEASQAKKAFFTALAQFQSKCPVIKKTSKAAFTTNNAGSVSYKFAELGDIIDQIREPLLDCGLSYRWEFGDVTGKISVTCIITHKGGHSETTVMSANADKTGAKNDIQASGSTLTYLRRYTLTGGLGIGTAEGDVDGAEPKTKVEKKTEPLHPDLVIQVEDTTTLDEMRQVWNQYPQLHKHGEFIKLMASQRAKIEKKEGAAAKGKDKKTKSKTETEFQSKLL